MTSSYLRTFLRTSALRCSTVVCARSIALVTILASSGTSSGRALPMTQLAAPVALGRRLLLVLGRQLGQAGPALVGLEVDALGAGVAQGEALVVAAEQDVDAAAGHVGGDRDRVLAAGLGHDLGFARRPVGLGVEDLVADAALVEQVRQLLGLLDRHRADE